MPGTMVTAGEVAAAWETLNALAVATENRHAGRLLFQIKCAAAWAKPIHDTFKEVREELVQRYGIPDDVVPGRYKFSPETHPVFLSAIKRLESTKCEIPIQCQLDETLVMEWEWSVQDMQRLLPFVDQN